MQKKYHYYLSILLAIGLLLNASISTAEEAPTAIQENQPVKEAYFHSTLEGEGRVIDLMDALTLSPELRAIHRSFRQAESITERKSILINLLWAWAYADPTKVVEPDESMIDNLDTNIYGTGLIHGVSNKGYRYFKQAQYDPNAEFGVKQTPNGLKRLGKTSKPVQQKSQDNNWQAPQIKITIPEDLIKKVEILNAFGDTAPRVFYYLDAPDMKDISAKIETTYDNLVEFIYYQLLADIRINSNN